MSNDPACSRERDLNRVAFAIRSEAMSLSKGCLSFLAGETYELQWIAQPEQSVERIDSASRCNSPLYSACTCLRNICTNASRLV
jgi:hypothetical protein